MTQDDFYSSMHRSRSDFSVIEKAISGSQEQFIADNVFPQTRKVSVSPVIIIKNPKVGVWHKVLHTFKRSGLKQSSTENITRNIILNLEGSFSMKALGFTDKFPCPLHGILERVITLDPSITEALFLIRAIKSPKQACFSFLQALFVSSHWLPSSYSCST